MFVADALAVIRYAKIHGTKHRPWLTALLTRRPTKVATIAPGTLTPTAQGTAGCPRTSGFRNHDNWQGNV
jgi:hypothetical protein